MKNPLNIGKSWLATALLLTLLTATACNNLNRQVLTSDAVPEIDKTRDYKILTAFFGLDNALPGRARLRYRKAPGKDGMPLVFSHELDPQTLQGADFQVTTQDGTVITVEAATLLPANEEFELRTVLLIGDYGNHPQNPPVTVKIAGDLMSRTGHNYKGQEISVIPLEEGPILSYAEYFTFTEGYPYVAKGNGCDCPKEETQVIVKTVWSGGVRAADGSELGDNETTAFQVTMVNGTDTTVVTPFLLADINDNDNNIDLCLKAPGIPIHVEVKENIAIDPRDDLNPKTHIPILSRW